MSKLKIINQDELKDWAKEIFQKKKVVRWKTNCVCDLWEEIWGEKNRPKR